MLFDIAPDLAGIPEDFQVGDLGVAGRTSFGRVGYGGPCPPVGHGPHRHYWTLYALDVESLGLNENAKLKTVRRKMRRKILAEAEFMGLYERQ